MPHRDIAKYLREHFHLSGWWAQSVTVGYERIRGLRDLGQRRGGTYDVNKSKTIAAPLDQLYRAWSDKRTRGRWLDASGYTIRSAKREKSMCITWADATVVEVSFVAKSTGKCRVAIQHRKLPDKTAAAQMKQYWDERLAMLAALLQ